MSEKKGSGKAQRCLEDALSGIVALRDRIITARAETLADAAVQLRCLVVMADEEPRPPHFPATLAPRTR